MQQIPDRFIGKWISELCDSDSIAITHSSILWKHFDDDVIDMLDEENLRRKFSGTYEFSITEYCIEILFFNVKGDSQSTVSGFYQFILDNNGRLHMHYQYELDDPEADTSNDSFWRECYIYDKV